MPVQGINLDDRHIAKLDHLINEYQRCYGWKVSRSEVVRRAVDAFPLPVCPENWTEDARDGQPAAEPVSEAA